MPIDINRNSGFTLPTEVAQEIIQKAQDASAVMQLATNVELPSNGKAIPVILGDADPAWIGETDAAPVSDPTIGTRTMRPYKMAVIETFSEEFLRDLPKLYDAMISRTPGSIAKKFDATVNGAVAAPGSDFTQLSAATAAVDISSDAYNQLVTADGTIATNGYAMNGIAVGAQGRSILLGAKDGQGRPLFTSGVEAGSVNPILGAAIAVGRGVYAPGTPNVVGYAGDWSRAMVGTVAGIKVTPSTEGTVVKGSGDSAVTISAYQNGLVFIKTEIELGFVADTSAFVKLTD